MITKKDEAFGALSAAISNTEISLHELEKLWEGGNARFSHIDIEKLDNFVIALVAKLEGIQKIRNLFHGIVLPKKNT